MAPDYSKEQERQQQFPWSRADFHSEYNGFLARFKVESCLELAIGDSALDLACGDGTLTQIFAEHFNRVVGVDASVQHLAQARKTVPKAEFHEELLEDFQSDEKFGSVLMLDILEHVVDPEIALRHAASFLKPDGRLIVHVPNAEALNRKIAVEMGTLETCEELSPFDLNVAGHRRYYTLDTLVREAENADLRVYETGGIFLKMFSTPQIDWFLENGLWKEGGFGWGRVGGPKKDWKEAFCRACYEIGKQRPRDCNIVFVAVGNA